MTGSRGSSPKSHEEQRAELVAQLGRLETMRDKPDNSLDAERSSMIAEVLRRQIKTMDEQKAAEAADGRS